MASGFSCCVIWPPAAAASTKPAATPAPAAAAGHHGGAFLDSLAICVCRPTGAGNDSKVGTTRPSTSIAGCGKIDKSCAGVGTSPDSGGVDGAGGAPGWGPGCCCVNWGGGPGGGVAAGGLGGGLGGCCRVAAGGPGGGCCGVAAATAAAGGPGGPGGGCCCCCNSCTLAQMRSSAFGEPAKAFCTKRTNGAGACKHNLTNVLRHSSRTAIFRSSCVPLLPLMRRPSCHL